VKLVNLIYFVAILIFPLSVTGNEKVIVMGYKAIAKPPLIGDARDNSGLYVDLFSKAAEKIGYRLQTVRVPKKRLHKELALGNVDFYPGSSFSTDRAKYLYYLPNGLLTKEVLVSLDSMPEISDMEEAEGTLIIELGSSKSEWDDIYPKISLTQMNKLSMESVVRALKVGRGDFYIADIEIVDDYKRRNGITRFSDIGIRIHHNAINREFIPMYMGFARNSLLFSERPNLEYDPDARVSISNFTSIVNKESVAYRFSEALLQLQKQGDTQRLYDLYFK
jgi:ABC-type amino acid transport substrate-binding protein